MNKLTATLILLVLSAGFIFVGGFFAGRTYEKDHYNVSDLNKDGRVDLSDLSIFAENYDGNINSPKDNNNQ